MFGDSGRDQTVPVYCVDCNDWTTVAVQDTTWMCRCGSRQVIVKCPFCRVVQAINGTLGRNERVECGACGAVPAIGALPNSRATAGSYANELMREGLRLGEHNSRLAPYGHVIAVHGMRERKPQSVVRLGFNADAVTLTSLFFGSREHELVPIRRIKSVDIDSASENESHAVIATCSSAITLRWDRMRLANAEALLAPLRAQVAQLHANV